jgi:hypothetical protein
VLAALATFLQHDSAAVEAVVLELQARLGDRSNSQSKGEQAAGSSGTAGGTPSTSTSTSGSSSGRKLTVAQTLLLLWAMSVLKLHQRPGLKRLHHTLSAAVLSLPPAVPRQPHLQRTLLECRMLLAAELRPARWRALSRRWQRRLEAGAAAAAPPRLDTWPGPLVPEPQPRHLQQAASAAPGGAAQAATPAAAAAAPAAGRPPVPPPSMVAAVRRPGARQAAAAGPLSEHQGGLAGSGGGSTAAARQWSLLKGQVALAAAGCGVQASWRKLAQGDEVCMLLRGQQRIMLCFTMPWHASGGAQLAAGQVVQRVLRRQGWAVVAAELQAWCALRPGDEQRQHFMMLLGEES